MKVIVREAGGRKLTLQGERKLMSDKNKPN